MTYTVYGPFEKRVDMNNKNFGNYATRPSVLREMIVTGKTTGCSCLSGPQNRQSHLRDNSLDPSTCLHRPQIYPHCRSARRPFLPFPSWPSHDGFTRL